MNNSADGVFKLQSDNLTIEGGVGADVVNNAGLLACVGLRARLVSQPVYHLRPRPDFRIARRALMISRLAQVISEREVQGGLHRVLLTQAKDFQ